MDEAGFEEIGVYIQKRQNTAAQYITTRPIMDPCERSVCRPGKWVSRWWGVQEGLDLGGARERASPETDREEEKRGEEAAQEETKYRS